MNLKERVISEIILREGEYADHPDDSGGPTKYGVTEQVARFYGYEGDMRDLPEQFARECLEALFWHSVRGDQILALSEAVAAEVVDTSVNTGPHQAGRFLQRALNVLNSGATLYTDLKVDGVVGPRTLQALLGYLQHRDEPTLVKALNVLQGAFYIELAERREKDESFVYGWLKNRVTL